MKILKVDLPVKKSQSYSIFIGLTLQEIAQDIFRKYSTRKIFIITDHNVKKLYIKKFIKYFEKNRRLDNFRPKVISIKPGEKSKTREMKNLLEDKLISSGANRSSLIVAFGGGVVGDLAGFTAACLFRGVPFVQIPTTLLSQVDSSVGGKVAVDHPSGKNLIGAFYHPDVVYIDLSLLKTLSEKDYLNGLAEVIKYGAILDHKLFDYLLRERKRILNRDGLCLKYIVARCCSLKADVVKKDEKEKSYRRILNFGHTIGHAIELLSGYRIPHGFAISIGMIVEAEFSYRIGLAKLEDVLRLKECLLRYNLPAELPKEFSISEYLNIFQYDKKAENNYINFTLLRNIGKAQTDIKLNPEDLESLMMFYDLP